MEEHISSAMRQNIDMDLLWRRACKEAALKMKSYKQTVLAVGQHPCPLSLDELLAEDFDFDAAVSRIEPLDR